jgi:protein-L-isoaspartate(D-aspartate) O-methyltransferase
MMQDIEMEVRYTHTMIRRDALDPKVMAAMERVPRHLFVEEQIRGYAYRNGPLPIGYGQTISQPYIVALMTDLIGAGQNDKVLEVGTGSGYQAAILAEVVGQVYSIEIIPELAQAAAERLKALGYDNIEVHSGDGHMGWPDQAPFDAILVTAAAQSVPPALIAQLKKGGRLVIPIGPPYGHQELIVVEKDETGEVSEWSALPVAFVPLTGGE